MALRRDCTRGFFMPGESAKEITMNQSHQALIVGSPLRLALEQVYPAPFRMIDLAVWYALQLAQPGRSLGANRIDHGTSYLIQIDQVFAQLFVMGTAKQTTLLRIHILQPTNLSET